MKGVRNFPGRCASAPFERMKQIDGQIGLFDVKPVNEKNECLDKKQKKYYQMSLDEFIT